MAILEAGAGLAWPDPPNSGGGLAASGWADPEGRQFLFTFSSESGTKTRSVAVLGRGWPGLAWPSE